MKRFEIRGYHMIDCPDGIHVAVVDCCECEYLIRAVVKPGHAEVECGRDEVKDE